MVGELVTPFLPPRKSLVQKSAFALPPLLLNSEAPCRSTASAPRKVSKVDPSFGDKSAPSLVVGASASSPTPSSSSSSSSQAFVVPSVASLSASAARMPQPNNTNNTRVSLPAISGFRSLSHSGSFADQGNSNDGGGQGSRANHHKGDPIARTTSPPSPLPPQQQLSTSGGRQTALHGVNHHSHSNPKKSDSMTVRASETENSPLSSTNFGVGAVPSPTAGFGSLASFFLNNNGSTDSARGSHNNRSGSITSSNSNSTEIGGGDASPIIDFRNAFTREERNSLVSENSLPRSGPLAPLPSSPRPFFPSRNICNGGSPLQNSFRRSFILQVSGKPFRASDKADSHTCSVSFSSVFPDVALEAGEEDLFTGGEEQKGVDHPLLVRHPPAHIKEEPTKSILLPSKRDMKADNFTESSPTTATRLNFGATDGSSPLDAKKVNENAAAVHERDSWVSSPCEDDSLISF